MIRRIHIPLRIAIVAMAAIFALLFASSALAGTLDAQITWLEGKPILALSVDAILPEGMKEIIFPTTLFDAQGKPLFTYQVKIPVTPQGPYSVQVPLDKVTEPKKQHRIDVNFSSAEMGIEHREQIFFADEATMLPAYGLRSTGVFPKRKTELELWLSGIKGKEPREIPVSWTIRDRDESAVASKNVSIKPAAERSRLLFDVSPDPVTVGPYLLEVVIENESYSLNFNTSIPFAHANVSVPVTSFEHSDPTMWFIAEAQPQRYQTGQMYYSDHFRDLLPRNYPAVAYDRDEKHSGNQSLRVDYASGREGYVWSLQVFPGRPLFMTLWVKGNNSADQLIAHFEDHINYTLPAWQRNGNFSQAVVCTLSFEGWKQFRVPVLGDGLQIANLKGSTEKIDAPIRMLALTVRPGPLPKDAKPGEPRKVWVDDLAVETQAPPAELLSLELRPSDAEGNLTADGTLGISVGNGFSNVLKDGRLQVVARDVNGEIIYTGQLPLAVEPGAFAVTEMPLKEIAAKKPKGPIDVDVTFSDPKQPGARRIGRISFKSASLGSLVHDFEEPASFVGFVPGKTATSNAKIMPGGAEGSAHSLALFVGPKEEENTVLVHPAIPGVLDHIEVWIKGGAKPVVLQPWLIDNGFTGMWLRPYNLFWAKPITVDWQDWRKVTIAAPPVPAYHGDKNRYFLFKPWYPLNLAFGAKLAEPPPEAKPEANKTDPKKPDAKPGDKKPDEKPADGPPPVEIRIDNVRAVTHLPPSEEVKIEVEYTDETRIHAPGSPLSVGVTNFRSTPVPMTVAFELVNYQGFVAQRGEVPINVAAGNRQHATLLPTLSPGIYELRIRARDAAGVNILGSDPAVISNGEPASGSSASTGSSSGANATGSDSATIRATIQVLKAADYFGEDVLATLNDPVKLRQSVELTTEPIYLDWDNTEAAPAMFHFHWFEQEMKKRPPEFKLLPVVGFSADWAGPEAQESLKRATYMRWIPNMIQVPERIVDWSLFVRNVQREYKDRFDTWVFWENPDIADAPQHIPPERYDEMLRVFHRWVKLYNPKSKVVAGGFNFSKALDYLGKIPDADKLTYDEIAIQMNLAELSPEHADVEGFLDDLNDTLKIREQNRTVRITELDWGIGEHVTPLEQAAYHARAAMILDSRGALAHQFSLINSGFAFDGYGIFYRVPYGNTVELPQFKPTHVPKPSYFALIEARKFLKDWKFVQGVSLSGKSLDQQRAFVYRNAAGELTAAMWRTAPGEQRFTLPEAWKGVSARDIFGFGVDLKDGLRLTPLPTLVKLPGGYKLEQLLYDLRILPPADGALAPLVDLHLAEPDSAARAKYQATGSIKPTLRTGIIPGGRRVREVFHEGLESEQFSFTAAAAAPVLMQRRWYMQGDGVKLFVKLNDGPEVPWDLTKGQFADAGVRESTFVLTDVKTGENRVSIRYEKPGNASGYRLEPIKLDHVPLVRYGILNARQTKGQVAANTSVVGTPLTIGKTSYEQGLGAHAVSYIEYPLDGRFDKFEVTVGIDGSTEGRGSVMFRVFVDGKESAKSGLVSGFTKPMTLTIDDLSKARRLVLSVQDAGDGNRHDLANWVDGKLYWKK